MDPNKNQLDNDELNLEEQKASENLDLKAS
jgi:hypothetical protein